MKKIIKLLLKIFFILTLFILIYLVYIKINNNKLWETINKQCISQFKNNTLKSPCIKFDKQHKYVIYKDIKGKLHYLLLPLDRISGIESSILQQKNTENYFILAWQNREHFIKISKKPINEQFLSLAINSKYGRTQDQLHIHLACLKHEVFQKIKENEDILTNNWQPLKKRINNHQYIAIKVSWLDINKISPFNYLKKYVTECGDNISYYGLAMIPSTEKNKFILLAIRLKFLYFNFGSAGEIQDYQCKLINN
ncbi:MAG: CDP-diacylglycerol diphosphatase [Arsenophonus sp. ET-DL9-MAG3]